jgi:hypothetical protein
MFRHEEHGVLHSHLSWSRRTNCRAGKGVGRGQAARTGTTLMEVTRDLGTITRQERELILTHFDSEIAWQLGPCLRDLAELLGR